MASAFRQPGDNVAAPPGNPSDLSSGAQQAVFNGAIGSLPGSAPLAQHIGSPSGFTAAPYGLVEVPIVP